MFVRRVPGHVRSGRNPLPLSRFPNTNAMRTARFVHERARFYDAILILTTLLVSPALPCSHTNLPFMPRQRMPAARPPETTG